jgi:FkbM family methyltransferase
VRSRHALAAAALLAAACAPAAPPPPRFDITRIVPVDLLRRANHGRDVLGPDGRFQLPPRVRRVWIDVGAHRLETTRAQLENRDLALIAVEPLEGAWKHWPDRARLIALPVALSTERGWLDFHVNESDATSSLLKTVPGNVVPELTRTVETRKVPALRLEDVLERVPEGVDIEYLKTDVQGHDLQVLRSAGDHIRRVGRIRVEVINTPIYEGSGEWKPGTEEEFVRHLAQHGFEFEKDSSIRGERLWLDKSFVNSKRRRGTRTAQRVGRRSRRKRPSVRFSTSPVARARAAASSSSTIPAAKATRAGTSSAGRSSRSATIHNTFIRTQQFTDAVTATSTRERSV